MGRREPKHAAAQIRDLLMEWDAIGVSDEPNAADEYDCMIGPLTAHLRAGADSAFLRDWIARERGDHFGLPADLGADSALAEALVAWRARTERS
ncbi:hypothetical protein [Cellulomonas alba]|uniref:Uncharacterized protein n=1 Tax=Cellulomonas alba TaxID=3053467 RepID=A0ABT7SJR8_9CELL|nr:hypothetical protein [Cellulomonas alba]MDM7856430.1 hypothetical protein [Cellulomonas alba]